MMDHLSFEQLCDLHDDALDVDTARTARNHLADCASCSQQQALLTTLAAETSTLPLAISPPDDLWANIKAEIAPAKPLRRTVSSGWNVRRLAAAAVLIAVGSSALTFAMMRRSRPHVAAASSGVPAPAPRHAIVGLPASLASEESGFTRSAAVLRRTLDERRDSLAPSTVATVERSLRVADSAIAEARDALARDPANRALAKLFASNYERKIDLLRRATELAPRT
jgi:hypothetical protein